jgi:hypothetical protein
VRQGAVWVPYPIQERQQLCVVINEIRCSLSEGGPGQEA